MGAKKGKHSPVNPDGMSFDEIAAVTGYSREECRELCRTGLVKLRKFLDNYTNSAVHVARHHFNDRNIS